MAGRAGDLTEAVAFDRQGTASDGAGGTTTAWVEQFTCRAGYTHLRGGETVIAARLSGTHVQVIRVRRSSQTVAVTAEWRVRDTRSGEAFNIREFTPTKDRQWIDFLCERGVAV
jgi:SPP1 family predicted phage head-tail adaptor